MPEKPPNWTPNQRRAIETLDRNVCVAAGAGSGKTGVLVERFLRIVKGSADRTLPESQRADVDQILVITFTDKATREMKRRIVKSLTQDRLHDQRRAIETAYISTIHGFCSRLLKENPFESGVDPQFEALEETESLRMMRAAFRETVERGFEEEDEEIVELMAAAQSERVFGVDVGDPLAVIESSVRSVLARLRGAGLRLDYLRTQTESLQAGDAVRRLVINWINPLVEDLLRLREGIDSCRGSIGVLEQRRRALSDALQNIGTLSGTASWNEIAEIAAMLKAVDGAAARASSSWRSRSDNPTEEQLLTAVLEIRELTEPYRTIFAIDPDREQSGDLVSRRLTHLATKTWEAYNAEKMARGCLDSDDLQAEAAHLLRRTPAVLQRYRRLFRYVMVDELQDTDPIQMQIIQMLSPFQESVASPDNGTLAGDGSRTANLFIVGDTQQSIYGFRNADCRIFQSITSEIGSENLIPLSENFRSRPEIIGFVNRLFSQAWNGTSVQFQPLVAASRHAPRDGPCLEALVTRDPGRGYAEVEATALAERICQMVESRELTITDPSQDDYGEPIQYKHIALLLRALTEIEAYERAFARRGVPFFVVGGGRGYYARREIRDVINILSLIECPLNDVALVATLRSPMVGLEMDTIYQLVKAESDDPGRALYLRIPRLIETGSISAEEAARLISFHTLVDKHRGEQDAIPVAHLLERIVAETAYDARLLVRPNGRRRLANLRKLLQMAGAETGHGVGGFISRLKEIEKVSEREGDAPTEEENANVVRCITIHRAKGLEFPVVFLGDMGRSLYFDRKETFNCDPETLAIGCRLGEYESAAYRAISSARLRREMEESIRVLYVALTRAKEYLVLCGPTQGRGRQANWADQVFPLLGIAGEPSANEVKTVAPGVTMLLRSMAELTAG